MTVLLLILLFLCVCFLCVALAPLRVRAEFSLDGEKYGYRLGFSWIHRAILRGNCSSDHPRLTLSLFFWDLPVGDTADEEDVAAREVPRGPAPDTSAPAHAAVSPAEPAASSTPPAPVPAAAQEEPPAAGADPARARPRQVPPPRESRKPSPVRFFLLQGNWRDKTLRCLGRTLAGFFWPGRVTRFTLEIRGGDGDPAMAGIVAGAVNAFVHALGLQDSRRLRITYEPVYDQPCLQLKGQVHASTSLSRLSRPVVRMLVTFPYLSTLVTWLRWRRKCRQERAVGTPA